MYVSIGVATCTYTQLITPSFTHENYQFRSYHFYSPLCILLINLVVVYNDHLDYKLIQINFSDYHVI